MQNIQLIGFLQIKIFKISTIVECLVPLNKKEKIYAKNTINWIFINKHFGLKFSKFPQLWNVWSHYSYQFLLFVFL